MEMVSINMRARCLHAGVLCTESEEKQIIIREQLQLKKKKKQNRKNVAGNAN